MGCRRRGCGRQGDPEPGLGRAPVGTSLPPVGCDQLLDHGQTDASLIPRLQARLCPAIEALEAIYAHVLRQGYRPGCPGNLQPLSRCRVVGKKARAGRRRAGRPATTDDVGGHRGSDRPRRILPHFERMAFHFEIGPLRQRAWRCWGASTRSSSPYARVENRKHKGIASPWGGTTLCRSHSGYPAWSCCILPGF